MVVIPVPSLVAIITQVALHEVIITKRQLVEIENCPGLLMMTQN